MAEVTQIVFTHKEVITALIKQQNLHEGIWMLSVNFGMGAGNVAQSDDPEDILPAAIIPVVNLALQKADKLTKICVDAAEVNPPA